MSILVDRIHAGKNDRTRFAESEIAGLADSIRQQGLIQLITLRPDGEGFEIVAGERRFRALLSLGYTEVEEGVHVRVIDLEDEAASAAMLIENVMRVDLDPIEEALAYQERIDRFGWTVEDIALRCGVSPITVQFRLKLLKLRPDVQHLIRSGNLPLGYAQILADADLDANRQRLALAAYRERTNPTPVWFRLVINRLATEQHQETLAGVELLMTPDTARHLTDPDLPADPRLDTAPVSGTSPAAILSQQIDFWSAARDDWQALGKTFKKQECEAVVLALETALKAIGGLHD